MAVPSLESGIFKSSLYILSQLSHVTVMRKGEKAEQPKELDLAYVNIQYLRICKLVLVDMVKDL